MERWKEDEKCFGGNAHLSQPVNEAHEREDENRFRGSIEMQPSQNENEFQQQGHKIGESRAKMEDEENLNIIKTGREGNTFPISFRFRKRKGRRQQKIRKIIRGKGKKVVHKLKKMG